MCADIFEVVFFDGVIDAVSGLAVVGRNKYGVFPLRGKVANPRDANHEQIMKNEEIKNLKIILGLQQVQTPLALFLSLYSLPPALSLAHVRETLFYLDLKIILGLNMWAFAPYLYAHTFQKGHILVMIRVF